MKNPEHSTWMLIGLLVTVLLAAAIDAALFLAWAWRKGDADAGVKPPLFARSWSLVDVWITGQVAIACTLGVTVVSMGLAYALTGHLAFQAGKGSGASTLLVLGVSLIAQNLFLGGLPVANIVLRYRVRMREIGLRLVPSLREVIIGLLAGVAMLVLVHMMEVSMLASLQLVVGPAATKRLQELTSELTVGSFMQGGMTRGMFIVLFLGAAIAAPIGEEIFFRGFLYNAAKRRFGIGWGVAISASVFALIHLGPLAVVAIVFMGAGLAIMYERTGSLWVTIIMHAVNNGVQVILAYAAPHLVK